MFEEQRRALPIPEIQLTRQETLGLDSLVAQAHEKGLSGEKLEISFDDFARLLTGESPDIRRARRLISPVFGEFIKHGGSVGFSEKTFLFSFWLPPEARIVSAVRENVLAPYLPGELRIDEREFGHELRSLQSFGQSVRRRVVKLPDARQIISTSKDGAQRVEAARILARASLLPFLQVGRDPRKTVRQFQKDTRRVISLVGIDNYKRAVLKLSGLERRLTTENLSINMMVNQLGCLDIEYCNEERIATYIRRISFHPRKWIRWEALSNLIEIVADRFTEGEMNPTLVFREYKKLPYADYLLKQLIVAAYEHGTIEELSLFLTGVEDEDTARFGRRLEEDEDYFAEHARVWRRERVQYERKTVNRT